LADSLHDEGGVGEEGELWQPLLGPVATGPNNGCQPGRGVS